MGRIAAAASVWLAEVSLDWGLLGVWDLSIRHHPC